MKNYKTFYENTIIDNIDFEGYENIKQNTLFDKINSVYDTFIIEYGHEIKRQGNIKAFTEWLQGLPSVLTVPFYYYEILENAKKFNIDFFTVTCIIDNDPPNEIMLEGESLSRKEDIFLNAYFENLAIAFFDLKNNL
jgi:hypothetical protein